MAGARGAGRIKDEDVRALREHADISRVVADHTALRQAGPRLKALCPFHEERTPSLTVDPAKGLFHCFGCGEGGDVYGFLMRVEALSFPEAVERLARLEGYELSYAELSPGQRRALGRRTRLVEVLGEAAEFYRQQLCDEAGKPARDYLAGRGLGADAIDRFRLGWAPDEWDSLVRHLSSKGFEPQEVADAGLATQGPRGMIDRFRGRVLFPIIDAGGRDVLAFGGRVVPDLALRTGPREGEPPKYINSPETEVYKKSRVLYALNWSRAELQRRDTALVVEGYMDVIGLHLAGVGHAVATCGTALTAEHFAELRRFAKRIVLALDADEAGYAAAERARSLAEEAGVGHVEILTLPPGTDPAELAANGAGAAEEALKATQTAVEFQITHLLRGADTSTPEGKVEAYRRTFPLLGQISDRVLRYTYVRDVVAPAVRLSADVIESELDAELAKPAAASGPGSAAGRRPTGGWPESGSHHQHSKAPPDGVAEPHMPRDPQVCLEREVLQAALQVPGLMPAEWGSVTDADFTAAASKALFAALCKVGADDFQALMQHLPDDDTRTRVRGLAVAPMTTEAEAGKLDELVASLRAATVSREAAETQRRLSRLNAGTDPDEERSLRRRLWELDCQRRSLLEAPR